MRGMVKILRGLLCFLTTVLVLDAWGAGTPTPVPTPVPTNCSPVKVFCPEEEPGGSWERRYKLCWNGDAYCPGEVIWDGTNLNKIGLDCVGGGDDCEPCPAGDISVIGVDPVAAPNQRGAFTITLTAKHLCACSEADEQTEEFTVTAEVLVACGSCMPDLATWTCNAYSPAPDGFLYNEDTGRMWFYNTHLFDFRTLGKSQGVGRFGSERLRKKRRVQIWAGGGLILDSGWLYVNSGSWSTTPAFYESGAPIECATTCVGGSRSVITDLYQTSPPTWEPSMFESAYCQSPYPPYGLDFIFQSADVWEDQEIYVDRTLYTEGTGTKVAGPITSAVVMSYKAHARDRDQNNPCADAYVWLDDFTILKSGGI